MKYAGALQLEGRSAIVRNAIRAFASVVAVPNGT
jgi:hypothetical protein